MTFRVRQRHAQMPPDQSFRLRDPNHELEFEGV